MTRRLLSRLGGPLLAAGSLLLVFTTGEAYFRLIHAESDGFGVSLAARRWAERHHKPINAYRIRDIEWDFTTSKPKVFILGDSFMEGAGIENIEDRLSGVLRAERPDLAVYNVARGAWTTAREHAFLAKLPAVPDALVFSYYMNDIATGHPQLVDALRVQSWIVQHSAFVNYFYWQLRRRDAIFRDYARSIQAAYRNPRQLRAHLAEVRRILGYAARHEARLVVLLFPILTDLDSPSYQVMKQFFVSEGVELIAVDEVVRESGWTPDEIIVSRVDPHPSRALHRRLAMLLAERL